MTATLEPNTPQIIDPIPPLLNNFGPIIDKAMKIRNARQYFLDESYAFKTTAIRSLHQYEAKHEIILPYKVKKFGFLDWQIEIQ